MGNKTQKWRRTINRVEQRQFMKEYITIKLSSVENDERIFKYSHEKVNEFIEEPQSDSQLTCQRKPYILKNRHIPDSERRKLFAPNNIFRKKLSFVFDDEIKFFQS